MTCRSPSRSFTVLPCSFLLLVSLFIVLSARSLMRAFDVNALFIWLIALITFRVSMFIVCRSDELRSDSLTVLSLSLSIFSKSSASEASTPCRKSFIVVSSDDISPLLRSVDNVLILSRHLRSFLVPNPASIAFWYI